MFIRQDRNDLCLCNILYNYHASVCFTVSIAVDRLLILMQLWVDHVDNIIIF